MSKKISTRAQTPEEAIFSLSARPLNKVDKYKEAIILRDADKLDIYGVKGLRRIKEVLRHGESLEHVRLIYFYTIYWLRTKTARQIAVGKKLFKPGEKFFLQTLKKEIKPIKL